MTQYSPFRPFLQPNAFMLAAMVNFVELPTVVEAVESRRLSDRPSVWLKDAFQPARHLDIRTSLDLVNAAHILDMMVAAGLFGTDEYWSLSERAKAFFLENPELLMTSWIHTAGVIHDMGKELGGALPSSAGLFDNQRCIH